MASSRLTPRIEPGEGKGKERATASDTSPEKEMPIPSLELGSLRQGG